MSLPDARVAALTVRLRDVSARYAPAAFSSSLSAEDMLLTDVIYRSSVDIQIFTIDTGRLHRETLELIDAVRRRYDREIAVYLPLESAVAEYVRVFGRNGQFESLSARRECCRVRKVEPLGRALAGKRAWITGLRREQSAARGALAESEFDETRGLLKLNPLLDWTEAEVWEYIRRYDVPCNRLYDHGYRSIGCAPCTRPVVAGEDARAGRWWWEAASAKECGLHVAADGRLHRKAEVAA